MPPCNFNFSTIYKAVGVGVIPISITFIPEALNVDITAPAIVSPVILVSLAVNIFACFGKRHAKAEV